jgi:hypothetical protein
VQLIVDHVDLTAQFVECRLAAGHVRIARGRGALLIVRHVAESKENVDMTWPSFIAMRGSRGKP